MWQSALFCACFFMVALSVGDVFAAKTKGLIISMIVLCAIYAVGFLSGFIPKDSIEVIGFSKVLSAFGMAAIITNVGTTIDLKRILSEGKTVLLCVASLVMTSLCFATVGTVFFGREYALAALPPVSGGSIATMMISQLCTDHGRPELAAYVFMIAMLQYCVSFPLTSFLLRRHCRKAVAEDLSAQATACCCEQEPCKKLFHFPCKYNNKNMIFTRLLIVAYLAETVGNAIGVPTAIVSLIFGVIGTELGLLEKNSLQKCGMLDFLMLCMLAAAPACFASLSLDGIEKMVLPVLFFLLFGAALLSVSGWLVGKLLKVEPWLAAALGLSAMYGYPFSVMLPEQVISSMDLEEAQAEKLRANIIPRMVVASFASVTICSVWVAGIISAVLF